MANLLSTRNWMTSSTNSSKPKMRTTLSSEDFSACNRNLQILISILVLVKTISTSVNLKAYSWNLTSHSTKAVLWETWTKSSSGKSSLKQALRPATSLWRNSWQLARRSRIRVWMWAEKQLTRNWLLDSTSKFSGPSWPHQSLRIELGH